ncbi:hypothetical protein PENTCL1PPCAC_544 [Pristionchus entomophagus]|uniref:FZ domain-containing protein n=1 Tax=Pristionchus entomophagus TaxID=358040 RepID=A0AAV5SEB1_9BILA|nr:hypothetical protein PENTCL1PPCAC_544 [Pristionchus entomophagus]
MPPVPSMPDCLRDVFYDESYCAAAVMEMEDTCMKTPNINVTFTHTNVPCLKDQQHCSDGPELAFVTDPATMGDASPYTKSRYEEFGFDIPRASENAVGELRIILPMYEDVILNKFTCYTKCSSLSSIHCFQCNLIESSCSGCKHFVAPVLALIIVTHINRVFNNSIKLLLC